MPAPADGLDPEAGALAGLIGERLAAQEVIDRQQAQIGVLLCCLRAQHDQVTGLLGMVAALMGRDSG